MKAVFDTNILVSALLSINGSPAQSLILAADGSIVAYDNAPILVEYRRVLAKPKFHFSAAEIDSAIQSVIAGGIDITPPTSTFKMDDPTDRIFYDTAKYCDAILITGNLKHYPRESFVMNPNDFLRRFNERENHSDDLIR